MYMIENNGDHLLVKFSQHFDCNSAKVVIHHLMRMKEYPDTNDIWLIGKRQADIRLGEIEDMVNAFHCHCPSNAARTKTAIVIDHGVSRTVIELWVAALRKRISFELRIFETFGEAKAWLGETEEQVA